MCPPLIITPAQIDELFDRLQRALDRGLDWVSAQRLV
jgi:4-aminobutyrate--pyruvate transaminase